MAGADATLEPLPAFDHASTLRCILVKDRPFRHQSLYQHLSFEDSM